MALDWNGAAGYYSLGSTAALDNLAQAAFAVSAWINPSSTGEGGTGRIATHRNNTAGSSDSAGGWLFFMDGTASLGFQTVSAASATLANNRGASNQATLNAWQHVLLTYDDAGDRKGHIYVGGTEISYGTNTAGSATPGSDASGDLIIGNNGDQTRTFAGSMAELAIWTRVPTADEIAALAAGYSPALFPRSQVVYMPMVRGAQELRQGVVTASGTHNPQPHPRVIYRAPIWVPVSAGGGSSLDLAASALAVSGAITASGDLQFRLPLDLSASAVAVTGAATVSGDLAYRVPIDLSASAVAVTGSVSVSGDIQSTTDPKLNISGSAIAVTGSLSATGDIQITEAPTLDLSASSVAVTGTVGAAGTLAYRVPFNLAADPIIVAGVFAASGDIGLSTEPVGVRGGGGWAWAAPIDASRYKRLKPQTREQLAERVRKQREALGILPAPARKRIEAAVKKEARRAAPSLAPLAPVAAEVAQDTGIALRQVLDAIEAAYAYQRGLVTARIEADAAHAEERRQQAAEQARVEAEAAEQEWQRRLVNLRAADDELLRQDDEARQQAIATIRQVQKALMALVTA